MFVDVCSFICFFKMIFNCMCCVKCECTRVSDVGACSGSAQGWRSVRFRHRAFRRVLHGTWTTVTAQLHIQVQSHGRRGTATLIAARMSQRLATRRSLASVSQQFSMSLFFVCWRQSTLSRWQLTYASSFSDHVLTYRSLTYCLLLLSCVG